jgi:acetyl esterase/lipase
MNKEFADKIRAIGTEVTPQTIGATISLCMPLHEGISNAGLKTTRDLAYGPAERHRLDVFVAEGNRAKLPVLLFVHGGGFVGGNKSNPGSPFYDNVGRWAARNGMVGVTITYRLAPEHRWPSGSDDVSRAVQWVRDNIGAHGGDPQQIYVMGQSAGAVHVAGYIAREYADRFEWQPAGAILVSGLYDTQSMEKNPLFEAYFGHDVDAAQLSFIGQLSHTAVPLMVVLAEYDPRDFQRQAVELMWAYVRQHQRWPRFVQLAGANHLSTVFGINASGDSLGPQILEFIQR